MMSLSEIKRANRDPLAHALHRDEATPRVAAKNSARRVLKPRKPARGGRNAR